MTLRHSLLIAPVVLLLAGVIGAGPALAKTVSVTHSGRVAKVRVGDRVVVTLDENPSTGYGWRYTTRPSSKVVAAKDRYVADSTPTSGPAIVGRGGRRIYTFTAKAKGTTKVVVADFPPGSGRPSVDTFTVTITVS